MNQNSSDDIEMHNGITNDDEATVDTGCSQSKVVNDWEQIYQTCFALLVKYALRNGLKSHDAEDIAAEAMKKLFVSFSNKRFTMDGSFKSYLAAMIRNEAINHYRAIKEFYGNGHAMMSSIANNIVQMDREQYTDQGELVDVEARQKLEVLTIAMKAVKGRVSERSWQMFCEVTIDNVPAVEVARKYGVNPQTVYQRNFQIRRLIREACVFS